MPSSDLYPFLYEWRGSFTNQEVNALHAEAFEHRLFDDDWNDQLDRLSLGWVTARDDHGLVGIVNIIWDGLVHAFVEDTIVAVRVRRQGVGIRLIEVARERMTNSAAKTPPFSAASHTEFEEDTGRECQHQVCQPKEVPRPVGVGRGRRL
ncbi:GNAT family N-acetyltransferase [Pseudarthrobacter sp. AB1]|uniref:GNAT family N-acetyltransferase n=1 Tax=Pseudarthrobacter sp. AB1 TaxID=2138309 RepID=UPI0035CC590F